MKTILVAAVAFAVGVAPALARRANQGTSLNGVALNAHRPQGLALNGWSHNGTGTRNASARDVPAGESPIGSATLIDVELPR